ncbi:FtsK/SpoIIIE domain-containing protein [Pedococcus aerophilus]|uniref:FtsK/SpoIIIE domain-containing protein n=1 Tax=Pedococcus aerophilus TaxID=436356 RepID=A0ABN3UW80_9MICO
MRLQLTVTHRASSPGAPPGPTTTEVEVDAPEGTTAAELSNALVAHLGGESRSATGPVDSSAPVLHVSGEAIDPAARLGAPPLLTGASLTLLPRNLLHDSTSRTEGARRSTMLLAVTHGPDCGRSVDLRSGSLTVGRSEEADLCLDDPGLSRLHAKLRVEADGVTLQDLGSTNGTTVDGLTVGHDPVPVTTTSRIQVGATTLALRPAGAVPAATSATWLGTLAVNRRPRILEPHRPTTVTLPTPPTPPRRTRVPWLAVLLPLPVAAALALFLGPTMLAFALMGPVLMVGSVLSDRWGARRTYAAELVSHEAAVLVARERVAAACREEHQFRVRAAPDPATVLAVAGGPTDRLWERRHDDPDAFSVSIGRCRRDASVRLVHPAASGLEDRPQLSDAPCTLALPEVGVLGVCGDPVAVTRSVRSLLGQLVTTHSPADLRVVALADTTDHLDRWRWLDRVPHCHNGFHDRGDSSRASSIHPGRLALDRDDAAVLSTAGGLAALVRDRLDDRPGSRWDGPVTAVLLDGAAAFRAVPDLAVVLADGARAGVVCLALGADRSELPHEAGAVLDLARPGTPSLSAPGHQHEDLVVDGVGAAWTERLGRALAPLRDATPSQGAAALPGRAGLLGLPGCPSEHVDRPGGSPSSESAGSDVAAAWTRTPHSTLVPLGVCSTGTFWVDLAQDGPHLLVGGTTGAGKSELLRTLVAALALHNSPEHLSFVLVDYKGGAAFRDCSDLPHVTGVVTDLDDQLASRALTSLMAEVTRRERLLRDAGVTEFVAYQCSSAGTGSPLARLVVVVDEFRALAEELPRFVDGLVHLAAVGRSLGIHLVLATQRPAGVVTADIKANVNLRIALRMRDRIDSEDVIDSPVAASISPSTPGRAHARVGGSPLLEFQAAHVGSLLRGGPRDGVRITTIDDGSEIVERKRSDFRTPDGFEPTEPTELRAIVEATAGAAALLGIEPAPKAWLPPLPDVVDHASLAVPPDDLTAHLGIVDVPEEQRQHPLVLDLRARGHWAVVGAPGTGRSSALTTVARSLCARRASDALHVYAVSGGGLETLASLPHVGASTSWSDPQRVERLVRRLASEVSDRRSALARRGLTTMTQWWESADSVTAPPPILLLVDDWDLAAGRHDDLALASLVDQILTLLREGEPVGLTGVLAGDRSLLLGRAGAAVSRRVVLRLADPSDAVLLGLTPRAVGVLQHSGRGLTSDGRYVQLALPPEPDLTHHAPPADDRQGPLRIEPLPVLVRSDDLAQDLGDRTGVALGVGGDEAMTLTLDPGRDGRRWLVVGGASSGVSTTVLLIAGHLLAVGRPVAVVAPRGGPLEELRGHPGIACWHDGSSSAGLVRARQEHPELAVVVDDAEQLLDDPVEPVVKEISHLVDRDDGLLVVGANATALSSQYRGVAVEIARHRTGVLLGPRSGVERDLFALKIPLERDALAGRGQLVRRGLGTPIQVALPTATNGVAAATSGVVAAVAAPPPAG